jgi:hypothetical protein
VAFISTRTLGEPQLLPSFDNFGRFAWSCVRNRGRAASLQPLCEHRFDLDRFVSGASPGFKFEICSHVHSFLGVCAHVFRGRVSERLCEVAFTEWTGDGRIRHPSFEGLREERCLASPERAADANGSERQGRRREKDGRKSCPNDRTGLRARVREQRKDEAKILFPSARGGRLSHDSVQYLVAKCAKSAAKSCVTLRK